MKNIDGYYYGNLFTSRTNKILASTGNLLTPDIPRFVDQFYSVLLSDKSSASFLDNKVVEGRLKAQLKKWIKETLSAKEGSQIHDSIRAHQKVGEVHSRVEIPMALVDSGMTIIKEEIFKTLLASDLPTEEAIDAVVTVNKILDAALSLINESYVRGKVTTERTSQEFVTASSAQEVALEVERIKNTIYQWMTTNLISPFESIELNHEPLVKKDFGLWIKHKLPLISTDSGRLIEIQEALKNSNNFQQNYQNESNKQQQNLENLTNSLKELIWLLTEEANANLAKESKQDSLTSLLERRFLDPILQQETHMALQGGTGYSMIMVDLDHFKRINDLYGHQSGDTVLRHCCKVIKEKIRLTDYAFRFGGEEMLIVVPEMGLEESVKLANRICESIQNLSISVTDDRTVNVTASLGVATFSGHPDYQQTIQEADNKLYQAKQAGRNCVRY